MVKNMYELDKYPWAGHSVIMGKKKRAWQDSDHVLSWFGKNKRKAREAYRNYIREGIEQGQRDDLTGGGLIRSLGGWSLVVSLRKTGDNIFYDERILGNTDFVGRLLKEADNKVKSQLSIKEDKLKIQEIINDKCRKEGVNIEELSSGSRRGRLSHVRGGLAIKLVEECGLPLAETGRLLGVTTSAISKILTRASIQNS